MRAMATAGFSVDFLDAADLLTVRMYESAREAWTGWGRSLSLPGVDARCVESPSSASSPSPRPLPLLRLLARRGDVLDVVLLAVRLGTLAGTARAYDAGAPPTGCRRSPTSPPSRPIARGLLSRRIAGAGATYPVTPSQKRRPMNDISAPVAAVRRGPSTASWTSG